MTRVADDFEAIRRAMNERGLDGDNGRALREQQEQAQRIDRELPVEKHYGDNPVSDHIADVYAYAGAVTGRSSGKAPPQQNPSASLIVLRANTPTA